MQVVMQNPGIDFSMLVHPPGTPLFRLWQPTDEGIRHFSDKLKNEYLYLSDEYRTDAYVASVLDFWFSGKQFSLVYEIGDFGGLVEFTGIIPGWKTEVHLRLWDKKQWGVQFVRQARKLVDFIAGKFQIFRFETGTADTQIVRLARMFGFEVEGVKERGFRWNGEYYDFYTMAIMREE